jgi:transcriptional regulator with XRE-family HTH domain
MTTQNGRAFNEWLRTQLKAKKMSQRQLAQQSGVDHSTISRLIRGDRMPSLGTATKLARGLRELRDDADTPAYLGLVSSTTTNPTARVEYALRADELLTEPQVRQIMEYYLAVRMRRYGRAYVDATEGERGHTERGGQSEHAHHSERVRQAERGRDHERGRDAERDELVLRPTSTVTSRPYSAYGSGGVAGGGVGGVGTAVSTVRTVARSASPSREPGRF